MGTRAVQTVLKAVQTPAVVFLVALSARLWALSQLIPGRAWQHFYQYNEFARIAWAVASGYGYSSPWAHTPLAPTAQQPPVYSYLLAGIFKLAGAYSYASLWIAAGLNAVLSAITAVLILQLGKRAFGSLVGVLAAWTWSCWLYEAAVALRLWESSLSALLLVVGLSLLPELAGSLRVSHWLRFGALAGFAGMTNTTLLSVFPLFGIWLWISHRRHGRASGKLLIASAGILVLTLFPWTLRNYLVFHQLMPIRDNFGLELWLGNHDAASGINDFPILDPTEYNRLGELRFMEAKRQIALQFIGQHPGQFLLSAARRCFRYWTAPDIGVWLPISALAWAGLILALRRKGLAAIPYLIVFLVFPLIYYITHTFNSYRHPAEPAMFLLAAYATVSALEAAASRLVGRELGSC